VQDFFVFWLDTYAKMVYNGRNLSSGGACPFLFSYSEHEKERSDAFVNCSTQLLWIAADTVAALAADITYVIAVAQAALQFVQVLLERIKK